jgi:hypothetical protein
MPLVERWEPPLAPETVVPSKTRTPLSFVRGQDAVPETVEIIIPRLAIAFALMLPSSGKVPTIWLSAAGPLIVLILLGLGTLQSTWGSPLSRAAWLLDGLVLGILTPILVVNAFAATGSGPLQDAESSVYLQTIVAATVVLIGLILYGARLGGREALSWGILFLPAPLTAIALVSAYADYKTTTIVLALSIAWFTSVVVTAIAQVVSGGFAAVFPAISYALYVFVANVLTGCGLAFGGRPAPVSFVHPVFIVVLGLSLLAPLVVRAGLMIGRSRRPPGPGRRRARGKSRERRTPQRRSRSIDDSVDLDDLEDFRI